MTTQRNLLFLLCITLFGCDVNDSSFIYDPADPRLPQYSEEGANTAGAIVDGSAWKSRKVFNYSLNGYYNTSGDIRINYFNPDSTFGTGTLLIFEQGVLDRDGAEITLSVGFFLNQTLRSPDDLAELEGREISLDGDLNYGQVFINSQYPRVDSLNRGEGRLFIREVGINDSNDIYIAGTFGFELPPESEIRQVFSGRFDYEVQDDNFFELPQ